MDKDKIIEDIRELILKWKGQEADLVSKYGIWIANTHGRLTLKECIADLQALYAKLVD